MGRRYFLQFMIRSENDGRTARPVAVIVFGRWRFKCAIAAVLQTISLR